MMIIWLFTTEGPLRFSSPFVPRIYVQDNLRRDGFLERMGEDLLRNSAVSGTFMVERFTDVGRLTETELLEVSISDYSALGKIAWELVGAENYRDVTLYNVDQSLPFRYMLEKGLFPNAKVEFENKNNSLNILGLKDCQYAKLYPLPEFRTLSLGRDSRGHTWKRTLIDNLMVDDHRLKGTDSDILKGLMEIVEAKDPDIIFTDDGDRYLLHFLKARASKAGVDFSLDRDRSQRGQTSKKEKTYFSYGRIVYKPSPFLLRGRIHIDRSSFLWRNSGLNGLIDLSRLSLIPVQNLARLSPGTAISAIQNARAIKDGCVIMWKKNRPELFKSADDLIRSDRGGFIFGPLVGLFFNIAEVDFSSMYPCIISRYNISPETVLCPCCPDSTQRVPELGYNVCRRIEGLLPRVVEPIVRRREHFKKVLKNNPKAKRAGEIVEILKWVLVTCFGYTGYKNARFGKIECHESITAYGREILLKAMEIAHELDLEVLHGIVDSLWITGKLENIVPLLERVESAVNIPLELEAKYKWIVFLPNRQDRSGALTRYYGQLEDGRFKVRGVEVRRSDTPNFLSDFQMEVLDILDSPGSQEDFRLRIAECIGRGKEEAARLRSGTVPLEDLVFKKRISKPLKDYSVLNDQCACLKVMESEGIHVMPGQSIRYVIRDSVSKDPSKKVTPELMIKEDSTYDAQAYVKIMVRSLESLFLPFGWDYERIKRTMDNSLSLLDFQ